MTTRKDVEYMENEIQKNTKLSHDIYNCLIESIDCLLYTSRCV